MDAANGFFAALPSLAEDEVFEHLNSRMKLIGDIPGLDAGASPRARLFGKTKKMRRRISVDRESSA